MRKTILFLSFVALLGVQATAQFNSGKDELWRVVYRSHMLITKGDSTATKPTKEGILFAANGDLYFFHSRWRKRYRFQPGIVKGTMELGEHYRLSSNQDTLIGRSFHYAIHRISKDKITLRWSEAFPHCYTILVRDKRKYRRLNLFPWMGAVKRKIIYKPKW
jgi:hypothetical protein